MSSRTCQRNGKQSHNIWWGNVNVERKLWKGQPCAGFCPYDIRECEMGYGQPTAMISLSSVLELTWDDLVAIDSLDVFCNVVTLGFLEGKLPNRILYAQDNPKGDSKAAMAALKAFIDRQRKIAQ